MVEDFIAQVDELIIPMHFIMLDIKENSSMDKEYNIFLCRPFMDTTKTIIGVNSRS